MVEQGCQNRCKCLWFFGTENPGGNKVQYFSDCRLGVIQLARIVPRAERGVDLLCGESEKVDVFLPDRLTNFDMANFILPVPDASSPAVDICSERSAAGMTISATDTL